MERGRNMANLVVRNLDQRIVEALKQRAARHGRSAEAEHRAILEEVLISVPQKKSFAEVLSSMPHVGQDEDFERVEDGREEDHVFD
jgi:plasmid stability protein